MHGRQRFWTLLVLSFGLVACATVKSAEDLDQDDRAAEGEPDAGLEDDGDHAVEDDSSDDGDGTDVDDGTADDSEVVIVWTEKGGSPVAVAKGQAGFGSKLVTRSITSNLD